jgi:hypothetical protein
MIFGLPSILYIFGAGVPSDLWTAAGQLLRPARRQQGGGGERGHRQLTHHHCNSYRIKGIVSRDI